jgi:cyanophycinase
LKSNLLIKKFYFLLISIFLIGSCENPDEAVKGNLIIIGGGSPRPPEAMKKFVELAGGVEAKIAIIPMASELYLESGKIYQKEFEALGVLEAIPFYINDKAAADSDSILNRLEECTGYFFGGGNQNKLTEIFLKSKSLRLFQRKYKEGAVLGGTSAGAAIMSKNMLTGEGNWMVLQKDSIKYSEGFGFIHEAIIDQHFIERKRFSRLLAATIELRQNGIGIDRETAIWVKPQREVQVFGKGVVIVIQTDQAKFSPGDQEGNLSAQNLVLDIYKGGDSFHY